MIFETEMAPQAVSSFSQQGENKTEVRDLCSAEVFANYSLINTDSHTIVSCGPVEQLLSGKRGTECPARRAQRDDNDGGSGKDGRYSEDHSNALQATSSSDSHRQ